MTSTDLPAGQLDAAALPPAAFAALAVRTWLFAAAGLGLLAGLGAVVATSSGISTVYFREHDIPALLITTGFMVLMRRLPLERAPDLGGWTTRRALAIGAGCALGAGLIAAVGWSLVFGGYPLAMDEFLARFDAKILASGHLLATAPRAWRGLLFPLQSQFTLIAPDGKSWVSLYLPVNAAFLAIFSHLGAPWLAGAAWSAAAVGAVYGVARKLWPARPDAAVVAAVLTATSTQVLITGMTVYAMSAHLALNMIWLWLFLRGGRFGHAGAMAVGFLAAGLHQVVFHPLFVAPFILELWLDRRRGLAVAYAVVYAAIGLFWMSYYGLIAPAPGVAGNAHAAHLGVSFYWARVVGVFASLDPSAPILMAENLFRLFIWQNPLAPTLAVLGFGAAVRSRGTIRALMVGAALTLALVAVVMPSQGHGWGYRYLHGFLGALSLVAALGWMRLTDRTGSEDRRAAWAWMASAAAFSLFVLAPLRAVQAHDFAQPYVEASRLIERTPADVVLVDPSSLFYATDLVRNDPWLRNTPKVMDLLVMRDDEVRGLCASRRVAVFDRTSGVAIRASAYPADKLAHLARLRRLMADLRCGERIRSRP